MYFFCHHVSVLKETDTINNEFIVVYFSDSPPQWECREIKVIFLAFSLTSKVLKDMLTSNFYFHRYNNNCFNDPKFNWQFYLKRKPQKVLKQERKFVIFLFNFSVLPSVCHYRLTLSRNSWSAAVLSTMLQTDVKEG